MRRIRILTALATLICATAASAGAQVITISDARGPRASLKVGYGGHGLDWETSVDSPLLADTLRVRAGVGQGRWDSDFDSYSDPTVTRLAVLPLFFIPTRNDLKPYVGVGFSAYFPRGVDLKTHTGARFIVGMEGSGDRWTVGGEVEIDLPSDRTRDQPFANDDLFMTGRIGIAVRRHF